SRITRQARGSVGGVLVAPTWYGPVFRLVCRYQLAGQHDPAATTHDLAGGCHGQTATHSPCRESILSWAAWHDPPFSAGSHRHRGPTVARSGRRQTGHRQPSHVPGCTGPSQPATAGGLRDQKRHEEKSVLPA